MFIRNTKFISSYPVAFSTILSGLLVFTMLVAMNRPGFPGGYFI